MKLSLYNIEQEFMQLAETLIESGGEITPELEEALALTKANLQTKAVNYGFVIKQINSDVDIIDAEIERLKGLKAQRLKAESRLKGNLQTAMEVFGIEKIETPIMKISFRASESVEIINEDEIHPDFKYVVRETKINKSLIKDTIKKGITIQGAILKQNKNIQIK